VINLSSEQLSHGVSLPRGYWRKYLGSEDLVVKEHHQPGGHDQDTHGNRHTLMNQRFKTWSQVNKAADKVRLETGFDVEVLHDSSGDPGRKYLIERVPGKSIQSRQSGESDKDYLVRIIKGDYAQKDIPTTIDYAQIKNDLDALEAKFKDELRTVLTQSRDAVMATVKRSKDLAKLQKDIAIPYEKGIQDVILAAMQRALTRGSADASKEIGRARKDVKKNSIQSYAKTPTFTPQAAIKWLRAKAFWVADVLLGGLTEDIRLAIINGLKFGTPTSEIITAIAQTYIPYLGDPTAVKDGELPTAARLETVVRTNVVEAYNQGRIATFIRPDMMPFLDGIRYSAILDSRTTPVCRYLHERIFRPEDITITGLIPPNHFNCFISGLTGVFTAKGWKSICKIDRGDLVLTHKGRFRPVTFVHHKQSPQVYRGNVVRVKLQFRSLRKTLVCTPDHPVLTSSGWKAAKEITTSDSVIALTKPCAGCSTPLLHVSGNGEEVKYCSIKCQVRFEYRTGARDRFAITAAANAATREKAVNGDHVFQRPDVREKSSLARFASKKFWHSITVGRRGELNPMSKSRNPESAIKNGKRLVKRWRDNPELHPNHSMINVSKRQRRIYDLARGLFLGGVKLEHPIRTQKSVRYADIALLKHKVVIEYDGGHWHTNLDKDTLRDTELMAAGWQVLHYRDKMPTSSELRSDVNRLLKNHRKEYTFGEVTVTDVEVRPLRRSVLLYNISVLDDESYIVGCGGAVVHNCRSLVVPVSVGELSHAPDFKVDPKVYITDEEILHAQSLADAKFLAQEDDVHDHAIDDETGVWRTVRGRKVFIKDGETPTQAVKRSIAERSAKAKHSHIPATKERQLKAAKYEEAVAKLINGKNLDDHEPFDVIAGKHAVEVKTLLSGKNPKLTMHPDSLARKNTFLKKKEMIGHTVAIDARGKTPVYYYREGVGSFRLDNMRTVKGAELKGLMK